jgi:hypothetical protein
MKPSHVGLVVMVILATSYWVVSTNPIFSGLDQHLKPVGRNNDGS